MTVGWKIELDGAVLEEELLTAGELALWCALTADVSPHQEASLHPLHCAVCRNELAVVTLVKHGIEADVAAERVRDMLAADLIACVSINVPEPADAIGSFS
jgi:hypothetical protein